MLWNKEIFGCGLILQVILGAILVSWWLCGYIFFATKSQSFANLDSIAHLNRVKYFNNISIYFNFNDI
jgi:hypothetical protein